MSGIIEISLFRAVLLAAALPLAYIVRHSLPFSWHFRILLPFLLKRWKSQLLKKFSSSAAFSKGSPSLRLSDLSIGKDPFQNSLTLPFIATLDDCDILGHLSNSSYPKNLDVARSTYAATALFQLQADGGWVPLGSISFKFHKEIAAFARYDIRCSLYAMTDKWFYLRNEFISKDKKGNEILHCESISKHCYKFGRKTIPPWFVFAYSGYSPADSSDPLSNWNKSQALRLRLQKANPKTNPLKEFQPDKDDGSSREEWMKPECWDLGDWQQGCNERLKELSLSH